MRNDVLIFFKTERGLTAPQQADLEARLARVFAEFQGSAAGQPVFDVAAPRGRRAIVMHDGAQIFFRTEAEVTAPQQADLEERLFRAFAEFEESPGGQPVLDVAAPRFTCERPGQDDAYLHMDWRGSMYPGEL